jgi:CRISPR-associated exonuclease Cas4
MYTEDELLRLSGLQHIVFCERQWGLIHIEQQWEENRLTADGRVLHERVHEQSEEARPDVVVVRGLPVHSLRIGLSGQADVVEFLRATDAGGDDCVQLAGRAGWWHVQPVEYKRGKAKREACDRVQLCAQALCLEEMFGTKVNGGALFYGTPKRRTMVRFDARLREQTEELAARMHALFRDKITPPAFYFKGCESCSLKNRCLPEAERSVAAYYTIWMAKE